MTGGPSAQEALRRALAGSLTASGGHPGPEVERVAYAVMVEMLTLRDRLRLWSTWSDQRGLDRLARWCVREVTHG